jgi:hypothetical protein
MQFETQQLADLRPARLVTVSETSDTRPPCFLALDFLGSTGHGTVLTSKGHHLPRGVCQNASASTSSWLRDQSAYQHPWNLIG